MTRWVWSGLLVVAGPLAAQSSTPPEELWVVTETQKVYVVDPQTLAVGPAIELAGTGITGTPSCLAFSQVPGLAQRAFVGQGRFVRVLDVATHAVLPPPRDVAALLGVSNLTVRTCAASAPRTFHGAGGDVVRSHLFLGVELSTGESRYAIFDQQALATGAGGALLATGSLHASAQLRAVQVLNTPGQGGHERAWYTLVRQGSAANEILAIGVSLGETLGGPATVAPPRIVRFPLADPLPARLALGAPFDRELPVLPGWTLGSLTSLDSGARCAALGAPAVVSVSGPGPNSYTLLALDPQSDRLLVVDPNDCAVDSLAVGADPVDVVPLGRFGWRGAFVVNRGSSSLTWVAPEGTTTTIPLAPASLPLSGGVANQAACTVVDLQEQVVGQDIHLSWTPVGCPQNRPFYIWCTCVSDPANCPCSCDCNAFPPPADCVCPFTLGGALRGPGAGDGLVDFMPGDGSKNPWKKLGITFMSSFDQLGQAVNSPEFCYSVTLADEPPPPP